MSHFTVLVAGENLNDDATLEAALAPFHEFECTGNLDQYVVDVDKTAEARESFAKAVETRLRDADGNLHNMFNERGDWKPEFSQPGEHGRRKLFVPAGYEEVSVPTSSVETLAEWIEGYYGVKIVKTEAEIDIEGEHKFGYVLVDEKGDVVRFIDRTNPNAKWDWWQLGGRWQGMLLAKPGAKTAVCGEKSLLADSATVENADLVRKDELDFDQMKAKAVEGRRAGWQQCLGQMRSAVPDLSEEEADKIRFTLLTEWNKLTASTEPPVLQEGERLWNYFERTIDPALAVHATAVLDYWNSSVDNSGDYEQIEDWINAAPALGTYAALIDGQWIARGEMGWFGTSRDEKSHRDWDLELEEKIRTLPETHFLAVVDCHI